MIEIGTLLQDRFLIEHTVGVGGMGAVYLATDQKFGSRVAIKQTIYDNLELTEAFQREARLLNSLHHPVLPHVSDFFSQDGQTFLVMEFIEGEDLSEILKRGDTLAVDDVVKWTFELLDALDYLHSQEPPVIHRDIKPNNLKLTPRGNVVLLDFGLAKETSGSALGMRSVFGYSRRYSPLEQIEGTGTDTRSDIFSLGATIYHLLTGEPPVDVLARASAFVAGKADPLKLACDVNAAVPADFAAVIRSAMSLNAHDRFASAAAMRSAIEFAMGIQLVSAEAGPMLEPSVVQASDTSDMAVAPEMAGLSRPDPEQTELSEPAVVAPLPVVAETQVASKSMAGANSRYLEGRGTFRSWPALAAALVLIMSVIGFGIYRSASPDVPEMKTEAGVSQPTVVEDEVSADTSVNSDPARSPAAEAEQPSSKSSSVEIERAGPEKTVKRQPPAPVKRDEPQPVEVAQQPAPERPRIVKTAPRPRQNVREQNDGGPVYTIESIFTGRPAGGWQRNGVSDEERLRR